MRRSLFLLAFPMTWVACFGSSNSNSDAGASFDGSTNPGFDGSGDDASAGEASDEAAVEAAAEAATEAGLVDSTMPPMDATMEASIPDAAPDTFEAGPAPITVAVVGVMGPEAGVTVVFHDATGAPLTTVTTGVTGVITQPLPTNAASLTVVTGTPAAPYLFTVMDLQPGANVFVPDWSSLQSYMATQASVTQVPMPTPSNASLFTLHAGPCNIGSQYPTGTVSLGGGLPGCIGLGLFGGVYKAAFPLLEDATDPSGNLLGWTDALDNGVSTLDDAGNVDVPLTTAWNTTSFNQVLNATLGDAGAQTAAFTYSEVADGVLTPLTQWPTTDAGGLQVVHTHPTYATSVMFEAYNLINGGPGAVAVGLAGPAPSADGVASIDVTAFTSSPELSGATTSSSGSPAQTSLSWSMRLGDLSSAFGTVALLSWNGVQPEGGTQSGVWTVVTATPSGASVTLPSFPSSVADYAPPGLLVVDTFFAVLPPTSGPSAITGYQDVISMAPRLTTEVGCFSGPFIPALTHPGGVVLSLVGSGGC